MIITLTINGVTSTPFKTPYKNHAAYYIFDQAVNAASIAPTALAHPNFFGTAALINQTTYNSKTLGQKKKFFPTPISGNHYFSNQHGDREDLDFIGQMKKIFNSFSQLKGSTIV
nr:hypothetical protein [uncultured Flavobacterium sp.]